MFIVPQDAKVLEIGGGDQPQFRPNLDIRPGPATDIVADLNTKLPVDDSSYDIVFSRYMVEHISWRNIDNLFRDINRILKDGGKIYLITANLLEQCRVVTEEQLSDNYVCMLFGDQNYGEEWRANAHYCGFSPRTIIKKLREAGFRNIITRPHPEWRADMLIKAEKITKMNPNNWTKEDRKEAYDSSYFNGGGKIGGYAFEGYWDYPIHWNTARAIVTLQPTSVLELGCARGYILKKLEDSGIQITGIEVSEHCHQTKVVEHIINWDITEAPWPFADQSIDLCYSIAVMEHIPEDKLDIVISETNRVCKRALHGVSFDDVHDDFDKTHVTIRPKAWWDTKFPPHQVIVNKEDLERGPADPPLGIGDQSIKLNIGCFTSMFYHGWHNIDILDVRQFAQHYGYKFIQHDMTKPLTFNNVDMIYSSHAIEHITFTEGEAFLRECHRIMRPGGIIRVSTPDLKKLIKSYLTNNMGSYDELNVGSKIQDQGAAKFWEILTPGHKAIYDEQSLISLFVKCGFRNVAAMNFRQSRSNQMLIETTDTLPTISLYVEAIK